MGIRALNESCRRYIMSTVVRYIYKRDEREWAEAFREVNVQIEKFIQF